MPIEREKVLAFKRSGKYSCPECQHLRKKHKNDAPLSVWVKQDCIVYFCHHCNVKGAEYYEATKIKS